MQRQVTLARIAIQMGDIEEAADESGSTPSEVLEAVMSWFPEVLMDLQGLPETFMSSKMSEDLGSRATAVERRRLLRLAADRAEKAHLDGTPPEARQ